jgi:hypothetical protein
MSRAKIETPEELEKALDEFIVRVGGTKERVEYEITPGVVYEGTQLYNCKEVGSTLLIDSRLQHAGMTSKK